MSRTDDLIRGTEAIQANIYVTYSIYMTQASNLLRDPNVARNKSLPACKTGPSHYPTVNIFSLIFQCIQGGSNNLKHPQFGKVNRFVATNTAGFSFLLAKKAVLKIKMRKPEHLDTPNKESHPFQYY